MPQITRRRFLQSTSAAALGLAFPAIISRAAFDSPFRNLANPKKKLRIAAVGVGGKGFWDIMGCASEEIVALCDVDYVSGAKSFREFPQAARYRDFRQMLDEMQDGIDAVIVSTPDHMHFPVALMAIERGKHVYVQKPLTHTIGEARILKAAAARAGVVTQMGNQGHANEGTRQVKEWIEAGIIGSVREVHCWTDRPIWPQAMAVPTGEKTVPPTMDWNLWLGVSPEREYSPAIAPFKWRGYWDYGSGALGDMGCHLMDAPFWALNLRGPVSVSAQSEGNSEATGPAWSIVTYEFPKRGSLPAVKLIWYDGQKLPPVPSELGPEAKLRAGGTYYVGEKGTILVESDYGEGPRLIPDVRMQRFKAPAATIPRVPGGDPYKEWITACKGLGPAPGSNIPEYSADLTEFVALGNVAIRLGHSFEWDPVLGECVGHPQARRFLQKSYRLF